MPASAIARFYCRFQGCSASYRRKEHLRRHEAQHTGAQTSPCPFCDRTFCRSDTLHRHVRRDHEDEQVRLSRAVRACRSCRMAKVRCHGGNPCRQCQERKRHCTFEDRVSPQTETPDAHGWPGVSLDLANAMLDNDGPESQIEQYIQLYFTRFHPRWPILHRATFSASHEPSLLLYSVVMIGMWVSGKFVSEISTGSAQPTG